MVLYYLGVMIVTATSTFHFEWDIRDDIRQGRLRTYLTKPLSHVMTIIADAATWRIYSSIISIPLVIFISYLLAAKFNFVIPFEFSWQIIISLIGAIGIFISMAFVLGYLNFFTL